MNSQGFKDAKEYEQHIEQQFSQGQGYTQRKPNSSLLGAEPETTRSSQRTDSDIRPEDIFTQLPVPSDTPFTDGGNRTETQLGTIGKKEKSFSLMPQLDVDQGRVFNYLTFPPVGKYLGEVDASIFYPLQQRYSPTKAKLLINDSGVVLYGATLCENVDDGKVFLSPCIFMQTLPHPEESTVVASRLEEDLALAIQISKQLEYYPWARYATSSWGCDERNKSQFRVSIQFGNDSNDILISLGVPYSASKTNALFGLADNASRPCRGLELFFTPTELSTLLFTSLDAKANLFSGRQKKENQK